MKLLMVGPSKERDKYTYNLVNSLRSKSISIYPVYISNVLDLFKHPVKILLILREVKILHYQHYSSLAYSNSMFSFFTVFFLIISRILRKKIVVTMQTPISASTIKSGIKAYLWKMYVKLLNIMSNAIIVHTKEAKKLLEEEYSLCNVIYVPNWAYLPIKKMDHNTLQQFKQKCGIKKSDIVLLLFGIPIMAKGWHHVISALPSIIKEYPNVKLLIAGDVHPSSPNVQLKEESKAYKHYLINLVRKLGLNENVIIYGYIPNELIPIILNIAYLIIFPYEYRPFASGALSEALSSFKPLVVSDIPTFEMLRHNETCVKIDIKSDTSKRIADAVLHLIRDQKFYERISASLYKLVTEELSIDKFAERHIAIYKKVIRENKSNAHVGENR